MPSRLDTKNITKIKSKRKAIWLFAGGPMQELAAQKILDKGYKLILTDKNPECHCRKYADKFIDLDTFDINRNLKYLKKLRGEYDIKAVLTVAADCHETVSVIAKELNLPGIDPNISHICRYKLKTRELLTRIGLPQPLFRKVTEFSNARKIIKELGLPVVIKSSNNSGSRGFYKLDKTTVFNKNIFNETIHSGSTNYMIIEKFLPKTKREVSEQSVETLWYNGKMYWLNWVDRIFVEDLILFKDFIKLERNLQPTSGIEIAHINPAVHDYKLKEKIYWMLHNVGIALGMHKQKGGHFLKADVILTNEGPYILELTPRLSGGWDSSLTTPLRKADFVGGAISLALGETLSLDKWHDYFEYKDPGLFASVFAKIPRGAKDSLGRQFSYGISYNREESFQNALNSLNKGIFLL